MSLKYTKNSSPLWLHKLLHKGRIILHRAKEMSIVISAIHIIYQPILASLLYAV